MIKKAEVEFKLFCNRYNIWAHKWRDVSYCPNCRKPIFPRRTDAADASAIKESIVDYLIFIGDQPAWIECKGKPDAIRLNHSDLAPHQREFLTNWTKRGVDCWLFVLLGKGKLPNRKAWLIPWMHYLLAEELCKKKSFSYEEMYNPFAITELVWGKGEKGYGWMLLNDHPFVVDYPGVLTLPPLYEESNEQHHPE